jgi:hypothetical protein
MAHFSWVMTIEVPAYFHVPIIIGQLVPGGGAGGQLPHPVFTPIICWWDGSAVCEPTRIPAIFTTYWSKGKGRRKRTPTRCARPRRGCGRRTARSTGFVKVGAAIAIRAAVPVALARQTRPPVDVAPELLARVSARPWWGRSGVHIPRLSTQGGVREWWHTHARTLT